MGEAANKLSAKSKCWGSGRAHGCGRRFRPAMSPAHLARRFSELRETAMQLMRTVGRRATEDAQRTLLDIPNSDLAAINVRHFPRKVRLDGEGVDRVCRDDELDPRVGCDGTSGRERSVVEAAYRELCAMPE